MKARKTVPWVPINMGFALGMLAVFVSGTMQPAAAGLWVREMT